MPQFKLYFMGVIYDRKTFMMPQFKLYFTVVIYDLWTFIALAPGVDIINLLVSIYYLSRSVKMDLSKCRDKNYSQQ
jgi:hypothetical protein